MRAPWISIVLVILLAAAAAVGVMRIRVDDSLSQLFRSDTPEFKLYEEVTHRFPSSEFDVLVVVEGKDLLKRDNLEHLRDLVTDLQLVDGSSGIISMFSAREPPEGDHLPEALLPDELPEGAAYDRLVDKLKANEIIKGKMLSDDGQLALVVLSLNPDVAESNKLTDVVADIRKTMADDLAGSGLRAELSGVPVMQLEIRQAVERDRLLYNAIGFAAGCLIAIAFFRRVSFMIIAAAPPLLAIVLSLGALGWLDFRLNMFLNVMTPLIMVISFSDSMQLTFAARDRLLKGQSKYEAFRNAVYVVGPACVLTHATAAISFIALQFSTSDLIRTFGEAGLLATVIALVAVLTLVPLLGVLLIRNEQGFADDVRRLDRGVDVLRAFCRWIALRMVARPGLYSLIALVVIAALAVNYANLKPRYQLADQVPDKQQAVAASHRIDAKLTGANPIDVVVEFPKGQSLYSPETLATIADVHDAVEKQAGVGNVWSLETLRRWLAEKANLRGPKVLKEYVDALPSYLVRRFISEQKDSVVVSGRIPDLDSSQLLPVIDNLNQKLVAVRAKHPGYTIATTGLAVIAASNSSAMIGRLNTGLTIEVVFISAFIGLVFRSFIVGLASVLPSVFPVLMAGTVLTATGIGLQFSSVVALIVSFGLGLSATIHFLNRMRREDRPGADPAIAVERATVLIGPALILTSVVLACGLVVTVFSDLPSLRLFGWLSAFSMLAALVADLLILRPTITYLGRLSGGRALPKPDGSMGSSGRA
jgi:predicted RND superfamily exporter protein